MAAEWGDSMFDGCTFTGNLAMSDGGAVHAGEGARPRLTGCTISGNDALRDGGGVFLSTWADLGRTVLWGNCAGRDGDEAVLLLGSGARFSCCVVREAGVVGAPVHGATVFADPNFCGPLACEGAPATLGDYAVRSDSPCLPENNPCGTQIGARGRGCDLSPVRLVSWGPAKASYRPRPDQ